MGFPYWADSHPGLLAMIIFAATIAVGVIGFFIRRKFFADRAKTTQVQKGGDGSTNLQAGGDINLKP